MDAGLEAETSPPLQLALAWAPARARGATLALFALDTRLAGFLRRGGEPLAIQMRLAWWRETLGSPPRGWPRGDPLLDELRQWDAPDRLVALVDGWEGLLGERLDEEAIRGFTLGREKAWAALAQQVGGAPAGVEAATRAWALADLAANLSDASERERVLAEAASPEPGLPRERELRPLAVLGGLGRRALRRGGRPLLEGRGAALLALRLGMFGR
ncbi:MAG: hypothetical protein ACO1OD_08895 [Croceibacterium sp.]